MADQGLGMRYRVVQGVRAVPRAPLTPPVAALVHLSIGSVYAYSMWNAPLTRQLGAYSLPKELTPLEPLDLDPLLACGAI